MDVTRTLASADSITAKQGSYVGKTVTGGGANQACASVTVSGLTIGVIYTVSRWVYRAEASAQLTFRVRNAANSANLASQDVPLATGWQYMTLTFTADGTSHIVNVNRVPASVVTFYTDTFQCEAGSFATPYVHTDGGTASRASTKWVA